MKSVLSRSVAGELKKSFLFLLSCGVTHFWIRTHISVILIFELLLIFGEFYVWQPKNPEKPKQHGSPTFRRRRRSHS